MAEVGVVIRLAAHEAEDDAGACVEAEIGSVLKPAVRVTSLLTAQVEASSPSGQQNPCVRQKEPLGQPSVHATVSMDQAVHQSEKGFQG